MFPPRHTERLERSRQEILQAVGDPPDLTLVRGIGNRGDELIWAGTRELLRGRVYYEIGVDELPGASGHTGLICGSGAFCHPFHEFMPQALAVAELRFERVILLPSTFDTSVDAVHEALSRTQAVIFARELESYGKIQSLCDARLAHDCAFFFDYAPYVQAGSEVLRAFRTDAESAGERPIPPENDDISLTASVLESWLRTISRHAVVQTDRAHVMIAAALLGKEVEIDSGSYFKVPAIADYALSDFPVKRLPPPTHARTHARLAPAPCAPEAEAVREQLEVRAEADPPPLLERVRDTAGAPRVAAVIISHNRPELALGTLHSLVHGTNPPVDILVLDNNSTPRTRQILAEACTEHPQIRMHLSDHNLGAAGARKLAVGLVDAELVLFLDDDAELLPGALEHMMSELDRNPAAGAVSASVVLPDGRMSHSGGSLEESKEIVSFTLVASGIGFDDPALPASGPCDWVAWTALLVRRSLLEEFPLDPGMKAYYEDNDWSFRVAKARSGCFRRSHEALAIHHAEHKPWGRRDFIGRANMIRFISAAAYFYRAHGLLLGVPGLDVFTIMPELTRTNGTLDLAGARLVMELAGTHSADWLLMEWMNGGLDPILGVERTALGDELHACRLESDALRTELLAARSDLEATRAHRGDLTA
jgi:GT2 family glycosyltransferase